MNTDSGRRVQRVAGSFRWVMGSRGSAAGSFILCELVSFCTGVGEARCLESVRRFLGCYGNGAENWTEGRRGV